jgi:hypothetical protein
MSAVTTWTFLNLPGCWYVLSPTRKETRYSDQTLTFACHSKTFRSLSVQPGLCGSNDLHIRQKMATFQLFFQLGRAKDLSAPLYFNWHEYSLTFDWFRQLSYNATMFDYLLKVIFCLWYIKNKVCQPHQATCCTDFSTKKKLTHFITTASLDLMTQLVYCRLDVYWNFVNKHKAILWYPSSRVHTRPKPSDF